MGLDAQNVDSHSESLPENSHTTVGAEEVRLVGQLRSPATSPTRRQLQVAFFWSCDNLGTMLQVPLGRWVQGQRFVLALGFAAKLKLTFFPYAILPF
jgi:hypothetical protein